MSLTDFWIIVRWWGTLFLVGVAAYPLTRRLFSSGSDLRNPKGLTLSWFDHGYLFSKAVGMAVVSWIVYALGTLHLLPFSTASILSVLGLVFSLSVVPNFQFLISNFQSIFKSQFLKKTRLIVVEELFFFVALLFWSWVKAHEPSIRGLEKFMDYGFMKSILNSSYFPPPDMWYAGKSINYYYFGHLVTALLTKLAGIDLSYTFNLMLATIFAFTITMSFSIGKQLIRGRGMIGEIGGGFLTAFLVTLAGNLQTIYAFTRGYTGDHVQPFWELLWKTGEFWQKLPEGLERYWYANATRFIPFTIHEFPSYSFVVSDVHGHVLSIPFVLLAIGLLIVFFNGKRTDIIKRSEWIYLIFYGFLVGVLLMTNALDGPIYFGLLIIIMIVFDIPHLTDWTSWVREGKRIGIVLVVAILTALPFLWHFESFVSGIAINCPPAFLSNVKFGPLIFEGVEKCQHSPLWMMLVLWGFFVYCGTWFFLQKKGEEDRQYTVNERVLKVFFLFSLALIIFPEFFYFKDIYPMHFRSNTMFKLGYQAFILFSIVSSYAIIWLLSKSTQWPQWKFSISNFQFLVNGKKIFILFLLPQLFLVSIYPVFSVRSYFNSLRNYEGIYGLSWLSREYPDDYVALQWLKQYKKGNNVSYGLVEADGDSYTDYGRFSAFTGIPTIIGWPVHEWLWSGSYDVVAPRREIVRLIYEETDAKKTQDILKQFNVAYVIVGKLERQKYPRLNTEKFKLLGKEVFRRGETIIYETN